MKKKRNYNTLEFVKKKFKEEQNEHPWDHVTKKQVYNRIKEDFKEKSKLKDQPIFSYRTMERAIDKLRNKKINIINKQGRGKYWLTEVLERNLEYQRKENEGKDKIIEEQKRTKKRLLEENIATVEMAKPYLDNLRYCESDEDWELLTKWFMKMHENKHYQDEAEPQEETEKSNAEITKEHPIPEKAEIPKNVKITEPEKLKPIEKTPWDE